MNEKNDDSIFSGLKEQIGDYASALGRTAISKAGDQVDSIADRLDGTGSAAEEAAKEGAQKLAEGKNPAEAAASAAGVGAKDKAKDIIPGMNSASQASGNFKFNNIVEWTDVGVPVSVAYNAFTSFEDWPTMMKKVEHVEWTDDTKLSIRGQVFVSHRTWEATITEMVPDSHIVWESTGEKGYISGSVSFHEVSPTLTRMLTIGEYHPTGFVERIGNAWKALGRRFRLELKLFVHHVMTVTILDPEGAEGWRGEIRDGEVVLSHEEALDQEQQRQQEEQESAGAAAEESAPEETEPAEGAADEEPLEEEVEDVPEEEPLEDDEPVEEEEPPGEEEAGPEDPDAAYDEELEPEDDVTTDDEEERA